MLFLYYINKKEDLYTLSLYDRDPVLFTGTLEECKDMYNKNFERPHSELTLEKIYKRHDLK